MLIDAHCHPFDLASHFPNAEEERRRLCVKALASACDFEEFTFNKNIAKKAAQEGAVPLLPCFAVHPQGLAQNAEQDLQTLDLLAKEGQLSAVGECGFDLYNEGFRETEALQDRIFAAHLETALLYDLPIVLHVRKAMHKIFAAAALTKCKAVIFHSWPGTLEEGNALLRRGINAYFSFGNTIINGHKKAIQSCMSLPAQRLLTETDAPWQPRRGQKVSSWEDLPKIIETAAALRGVCAKDLETQIENNFSAIF